MDSWRRLRKLGQSAFTEVWLAEQSSTLKKAALKIPTKTYLDSKNIKTRLEREAWMLRKIHHPGFVRFLGADFSDETPYLATEFVSGQTLLERLRKEPVTKPESILEIARQILEALTVLHELKDEKGRALNAVHGDLCPANIILSEDGRVVICDLGSVSSEVFTRAKNEFHAHPNYASPEHDEGKNLDARSDLFSFGAMVYEMLTGEPRKAAACVTTPAPLLNTSIPESVLNIVMKCLSQKRSERPASTREVLSVWSKEI